MAKNSDIKAIKSDSLSSSYDTRFVIVNTETGEILDDAQGYGYRSAQKAYAAYTYKHRDKSKDRQRKQEEKAIRKWWQDHKELSKDLEQIAFEIAKGSWGPDDKLDAKLLKTILKQENIESEHSPGKLLKIWKRL